MKKSLYQRIIIWVLLVVVLGMAVLAASNIYLMDSWQRSKLRERENTLERFAQELDQENNSLSTSIRNFMGNIDVQNYCYRRERDPFVESRVSGSMMTTIQMGKYLSGLWVYSDVTGHQMWRRDSGSCEYREMEQIQEIFGARDELDRHRNNSWNLVVIEDRQYLVFLSYNELMCAGAWCLVEEILGNLSGSFLDEIAGAELTDVEPGERDGIIYYLGEELDSVSDAKLLVFFGASSKNNVSVVLLLLLSFSVVCVICMGILVRNLQKYLLKPVWQITDAIRRIGRGEFEYHLATDSYVKELETIGENLNEMTGQISHLKVSIYEEQLQKKEARLQFYNAQIQPHFMLNVINSIYSMVSVGERDLVLKLCRYLAEYMRYVFSSKEMVCTLEQELTHLREYVKIQELRFPGEIHFEIEAAPELWNGVIPTMSVHAFVENIFKHGYRPMEPLFGGVKGELEEGQICRIEIWNSGPGFSEELCRIINKGCYSELQRVGIRNTIGRFQELYGEAFSIKIENHPLYQDFALVPLSGRK